jgi:hypothetical protein
MSRCRSCRSRGCKEIRGLGFGVCVLFVRGPADKDAGFIAAPEDDARIGTRRACQVLHYYTAARSDGLGAGRGRRVCVPDATFHTRTSI